MRLTDYCLTEEDRKKVNLDLLIYFDAFCRKNSINYSLTGGTLLGAIRHKGFIPWDDDVDVFLTRPEYEKLNKAFQKSDPDKRYEWVSREIKTDYEYVFGRLIDNETIILNTRGLLGEGRGLFIDVCVIDGLPKNMLLREIHIFYMRMLFKGRRCVHYELASKEGYEKNIFDKAIKGFIARTTSLEFWQKKMFSHMKKYKFDKSDFVGNFTSQYGRKELMHRSSFDSYFDVEFEGYKFSVCSGWEEYLKNIYGDYMKLPPESRRIGHHVSDVYWTNENHIK